MKKVISFIIAFSMIFALILAPVKVRAEEVAEQPESEQVEEEQELTFDEFKDKATEWISQYTGESIAVKIIGWLIDAGVLGALFCVSVKYSKYKNKTLEELVGLVVEKAKERVDDLATKEIKNIDKKINQIELSNETIMKVLVLSQDNTAKGKVALLEYLGSKTNSQEIKESVEQVNAEIEKQEEAKQEVLEKVENEYKEIF